MFMQSLFSFLQSGQVPQLSTRSPPPAISIPPIPVEEEEQEEYEEPGKFQVSHVTLM